MEMLMERDSKMCGIDGSEDIRTGASNMSGRKPLSPAFRMAILAGALASVRLHLCSGGDVNATDEKGRSPLILAASRGHLDVCQLLLEEGADPAIKDHEGNDALSVAVSRGQNEIAALLAVAHALVEEPLPGERVTGKGQDIGTFGDVVSHTGETGERADVIEATADLPPVSVIVPHFPDGGMRDGASLLTPTPDADDMVDLSAWQEEIEGPPPLDDPSCAGGAAILQKLLSRHVPIDTDESWDDVAIDLPEPRDLMRRHAPLTADEQQTLRMFLLEALREPVDPGGIGGLRHDHAVLVALEVRIPGIEKCRVPCGGIEAFNRGRTDLQVHLAARRAAPRCRSRREKTETGETDDPEGLEWESRLRLILGDLGVVIDEDSDAPDAFLRPIGRRFIMPSQGARTVTEDF
jgi:hypothetical protein